MNILYMNQGGGGQWGAIKYSTYDLILLAESDVKKTGFLINWRSSNTPVMSVQQNAMAARIISAVQDVDLTAQQVRPIATFVTRDGIRIVFVHLKSGSEPLATAALQAAIAAIKNLEQFGLKRPTLWVGDFNRAKSSVMDQLPAEVLFSGGGQALWDLDRAYVSGDWSKFTIAAAVPSTAGADNGHIAIAFTIAAA